MEGWRFQVTLRNRLPKNILQNSVSFVSFLKTSYDINSLMRERVWHFIRESMAQPRYGYHPYFIQWDKRLSLMIPNSAFCFSSLFFFPQQLTYKLRDLARHTTPNPISSSVSCSKAVWLIFPVVVVVVVVMCVCHVVHRKKNLKMMGLFPPILSFFLSFLSLMQSWPSPKTATPSM